MMRAILALILLLIVDTAHADQLPVVNGVGATVQMNMKQDGAGAYSNRNLVCDAASPDSCAPVDTIKGLAVNVTGLIGQGIPTAGQLGLLGMGAATTTPPAYISGQTVPLSIDASGNLRTISLGQFASSTDAIGTSPGLAGSLAFNMAFNGVSWDRLRDDGSENLLVNCVVGCAQGAQSNGSDAQPVSTTSGQGLSYLYAFNGTSWDRLRDDGSFNLKTNCVVGCSGGTTSNASDAVATNSSNGQTVNWNYGFNGATWDRLQVDGSKNLKVVAALSAGTNQIGHVITDSGSTVQLAGGANKVGIVTTDQTTPGTTDLVHVAGVLSNASDAVATTATNAGHNSFNYAFNGTTWDRVRDDASKNVMVNCAAGCSGGTLNNNADAVATSATNGQAAAWLYAFNGTTFDRLRDDASKNLDVNINAAIAAGTNTIGKLDLLGNAGAIMDFAGQNAAAPANALLTGCTFFTTPTTLTTGDASPRMCDSAGNALVNLKTALPAGTAIIGKVTTDQTTPGTTDLVHAAQNGTWTNTVTQATGSNLHVACDAGCSSSPAPADESAFTFGTTSQTPTGGVFQTTATSNPLTTGQMGAFQVTANRALFTNLRTSAGVETGIAAAPLQVSLANTAANATAVSVALAANQSVNTAQVNGITTLTGSGTTGSGAQRIAVSQDITTIAGAAPGTAGTASANVLTVQGIASMTPVKTDLLGATGATLDFAGQNQAAVNATVGGCLFVTAPTTVTTGNVTPT